MQGLTNEDEARLKYHSGSFDIIKPGSYVSCAVTKKRILVENLRYWNARLQEAYISADVAFNRFFEKN